MKEHGATLGELKELVSTYRESLQRIHLLRIGLRKEKVCQKYWLVGAGGVGSVAVHKMAQLPEVFSSIYFGERRESSSCEKLPNQ